MKSRKRFHFVFSNFIHLPFIFSGEKRQKQGHRLYVLDKTKALFHIPIKLQSWREKWNGHVFCLNVR